MARKVTAHKLPQGFLAIVLHTYSDEILTDTSKPQFFFIHLQEDNIKSCILQINAAIWVHS